MQAFIQYTSFVTFVACSQVSLAKENCELSKPPKEAGVNSNHGQFFFVYPRFFDSNYTGCQTMWDEHGKKWWVLHLERGLPKQLSINIPSTPATQTKCIYIKDGLVNGSADDCPDYQALKKGIPTIPKELEPQIPRERDPRG